MNERFKELSKQAMDYAAQQYGPQRNDEQVWKPEVYDQKFAELIVLECIKIVQDTRENESAGNNLIEFWFEKEQS